MTEKKHFFEFDIQNKIKHLFKVRNLAEILNVKPHGPNIIDDVTNGSENKSRMLLLVLKIEKFLIVHIILFLLMLVMHFKNIN